MTDKREFGDYQTPLDFASFICRFLKTKKGLKPSIVFEPTCGVGNFLKSSLILNASRYVGVEINGDYCDTCRSSIEDCRVSIFNADFFGFDLSSIREDNLLVIGNPPWVNSSTLSVLESNNIPKKTNYKGLKGLDAITGASNFDICETIILKLINAFRNSNSFVAMLCKTSVARNIFVELKRQSIEFSEFEIFEFDATKVFGVNVSACLLFVNLAARGFSPDYCRVFSFEDINTEKRIFGYRNGQLYSDLIAKRDDFDGECCFEWRQGVKHDCSKVMELTNVEGCFINGNNEDVVIERELVFPLVKSSMFKAPLISSTEKYVIVTQRKIGEDTSYIREKFPLTWDYLQKNRDFFEKRKSSIYKNAPAFAVFGIGEYSYAEYKVGISGFYKEPLFSVLCSIEGKPVMTDDTSYFMSFPSFNTAYVAMLYLNNYRVKSFLKQISFSDSKRPYTKRVLSRIDFAKLNSLISFEELKETERLLALSSYLLKSMVFEFLALPEMQLGRSLF